MMRRIFSRTNAPRTFSCWLPAGATSRSFHHHNQQQKVRSEVNHSQQQSGGHVVAVIHTAGVASAKTGGAHETRGDKKGARQHGAATPSNSKTMTKKGKGGGEGGSGGGSHLASEVLSLIQSGQILEAVDVFIAAVEAEIEGNTKTSVTASFSSLPPPSRITTSAAALVLHACEKKISSSFSVTDGDGDGSGNAEQPRTTVPAASAEVGSSSLSSFSLSSSDIGDSLVFIAAAQRVIRSLQSLITVQQQQVGPVVGGGGVGGGKTIANGAVAANVAATPSPRSFEWDSKLASLVIRIQCRAAAAARPAHSDSCSYSCSSSSSSPSSALEALKDAAETFQWLVQRHEVRHRSLSPYLRCVCESVVVAAAASSSRRDDADMHGGGVVVISERLATINYLIGISSQFEIILDEGDYCAVFEAFGAASSMSLNPAVSSTSSAVPLSFLHHLLLMMQQHLTVGPLENPRTVAALRKWVTAASGAGGGGGGSGGILREASLNLIVDESTAAADRATGPCSSSPTAATAAAVLGATCSFCAAPMMGHPYPSALRTSLLTSMVDTVVPSIAKRNTPPQQAKARFEAFARYIHTRRDANVYIDGANVGYYGLSNWYGEAKRRRLMGGRGGAGDGMSADQLARYQQQNPKEFVWDGSKPFVDVPPSFELIDKVLTELSTDPKFKSYNFSPLIFLHKRHTESHNMIPGDEIYLSKWLKNNQVYCSPDGVNDDLCWLYACFYHTTPTDQQQQQQQQQQFHQYNAEANRRRHIYIVTNDLMRDHIFALFDRKSIGGFRDRARIGLTCRFDAAAKTTEIDFAMPQPFANCIQFDATRAKWHVPYRTGAATTTAAAPSTSADEGPSATGAVKWLCIG